MLAEPELLVIGAGPAGLSAASEATRAGVSTIVIDAGETAGGQYYAHPPGGAWDDGLPSGLLTGARRELLELQLGTSVWGIFGDRVALLRNDHSWLVRPAAIVLATGAAERVVPFPGWDRPGVIAPGGIQRLLKVARVVPNGAIVLAGSGPFLLAVAADLRRAGAEVRAVVEQRTRRELLPLAPVLAQNSARRREALRFARALRGVPLRFGAAIQSADDTGVRLTDGSYIAADVLCAGYGFSPRLELARMLELDVRSDGVCVNRTLETSRPGVFAAGEVTGIGGAPLATAEGRLAGLAAARYLGQSADPAREQQLQRVRDLHARFASSIERVYTRVPVLAAATADTTICRCEGVTLAELDRIKALPAPADDLRTVRAELRCGMGACQGAICTEAVAAAVGSAPLRFQDHRVPRARPPAVAVSVGTIAGAQAPSGLRDSSASAEPGSGPPTG